MARVEAFDTAITKPKSSFEETVDPGTTSRLGYLLSGEHKKEAIFFGQQVHA